MMIKSILFVIISVFLFSCSGTHQKNLEALDKTYGKCDNPYRQYNEVEYRVCKDQERAAGPDGTVDELININELISGIGKKKTTIIQADTNSYLWDASLQVLNSYSFKIIDFDGGFIETNWIYEENKTNQRCLIKTHITSVELVSNGVSNKIICEIKMGDDWYLSNESFVDAEKNLTLKILKEAFILSSLSTN